MRKKYVFLTGTIGTIGGGQIYVRNKVKYLQETGWEVEVFSHCNDYIMVEELRCFKKNVIDLLKFKPKTFSKRQTRATVEKISSIIKKREHDEVIIESHEIQLSLWGEMIANKLRCKHIVFLLSEGFPKLPLDILKFFDFKHKRRELAGINKKSLELLFKDYKVLSENEKYSLKAMCTNSVDDVPNDVIDSIKKKDINIGCISRLQKTFITTMVDEVVHFSKTNGSKTIQLVLVGGSPGNLIEKDIIKKTENVANLKVVMTGRLFPIPKRLFELMDIFIGVAGSAGVSANEGILTLTVDVMTHKPIGLLGYDTANKLYAAHSSHISISDALEKILVKDNLQNKNININYKIADFRRVFPKHLDFIDVSCKENKYYDVGHIKLDTMELIKKYLVRVVGKNIYKKMRRTIKKKPRLGLGEMLK